MRLRLHFLIFCLWGALAACSVTPLLDTKPFYPNETPEIRRLIAHYANFYELPVDLVERVVIRESSHRPKARNGPYYGLMQISPATANSMGYKGPAEGLLDAETNLKFAGKYLKGAYLVANGNSDRAIKLYAKGYYYEAKAAGLLVETSLRPTP
ncbi:MAG: lytic transglycosylase domain-containing protein [Paracoccaceae bacterium]|nr:lytic transglycosylase domain-containing protein [Paracoccaceae bacterium]MDP5357093.1 lytic transglycosylase domain-containing protein [Paracoccaceae bacterium]